MKQLIEPRILKGFRDYTPDLMIPRRVMITLLEEAFASFGFKPIDTPALEFAEILTGKGSDETDKQMYRFSDNGGRDVALRFDLTVPLARFAAMHISTLGTPFRRYHIAPVWRAEKPQRGRYREFVQCDFDIIGSSSLLADAEIITLIRVALESLGVKHRVYINNRKLLAGLLELLNIDDRATDILRAIDKLEKLGHQIVHQELTASEIGLSSEQADSLLAFLEHGRISNTINGTGDSAKDDLNTLESMVTNLGSQSNRVEKFAQGAKELREIFLLVPDAQDFCSLDLTIARGLDYYTGLVFETKLLDLPQIGSICSGGRYDDLASVYTKQQLPGVGASIGLDRLLAGLEELGELGQYATSARVLIAFADRQTCSHVFGLKVAKYLRDHSISCEVYSEQTKLGNQLKYADKHEIPLVAIIGETEVNSHTVSLKNLTSGDQTSGMTLDELVLRARLQTTRSLP